MTLSSSARRAMHAGLSRLAEAPVSGTRAALEAIYVREPELRAAHPINEAVGLDAHEAMWTALKTALPDCERRDGVFIAGAWNGTTMVAATGHYCGTFKGDLFGIPATGRTLYLRYGEVHELDPDGRIQRSNMLFDFLDAMRQADVWPLAPSLGVEAMWPGPITGDGLRLDPSPGEDGAAALKLTLDMHDSLHGYDDTERLGRQGLLDMPQKNFWHERMMWYGPAGSGTTRGLEGFVDHHQLPFRLSLPNRKGGQHYVRIGDGPYSATGGWPSVTADHHGGVWMGLPTSGRTINMRVMDFYLAHEGKIRENWVPIDIIDVLRQLDVDVFARMKATMKRAG